MYIYYITAAGNSITPQLGSSCQVQPIRHGKGRRYGPSITYKITPVGSLSFSQPGGPPCWAYPLCLRPHCLIQCIFRSLSTVASMGRNNYLTPLFTSSVLFSFLYGEVLHSSNTGLILGRNWDKSLPPSLLFTVTSTNGFYSPPSPFGLKLVCCKHCTRKPQV
jgi:hypothetical protein